MKSFDTINVIPFIDILLVLLAMVLTTATFVNTGQLDIALPTASARGDAATEDPIEIAVDEEEQLYLDSVAVSLEELHGQLIELKSGVPYGKTPPVRLMIDEQVSFQRFVSVADLLKRLAMDDVSIVTKPTS